MCVGASAWTVGRVSVSHLWAWFSHLQFLKCHTINWTKCHCKLWSGWSCISSKSSALFCWKCCRGQWYIPAGAWTNTHMHASPIDLSRVFDSQLCHCSVIFSMNFAGIWKTLLIGHHVCICVKMCAQHGSLAIQWSGPSDKWCPKQNQGCSKHFSSGPAKGVSRPHPQATPKWPIPLVVAVISRRVCCLWL